MKLKKLSSFFITMAIMGGMSGLPAYGAEKTQDDVKLTVSADKDSYGADEKIVVDISLENNSDSDITDVTLESLVPGSYRLADDSSSVKRATYIMAGDSISFQSVFLPDKSEKTSAAATAEVTAVTEKTAPAEAAAAAVTTAESGSDDDSGRKSGNSAVPFIIAGVLLAGAAGAFIVLRKKKGGKALMILLCISAAGSFANAGNARAEEADSHSFSVSRKVTVDGSELELTANVRFTMDISDMQTAVEEYYQENSEEIVAVEKAEETEKVFTEKEALAFLNERGFTEYPLVYDYNMDGTYVDEVEASADSDEKHPMYQTYYAAADGSIWMIYIVGRTIVANPASYNLESDLDAQVMISETETLTSYTEMGNKFYETVPKESAVILKIVDKITSQRLGELTYEEVINEKQTD